MVGEDGPLSAEWSHLCGEGYIKNNNYFSFVQAHATHFPNQCIPPHTFLTSQPRPDPTRLNLCDVVVSRSYFRDTSCPPRPRLHARWRGSDTVAPALAWSSPAWT